ncbi:MAG: glycerol-3-phosphate 1-O-acyltransferase PlsY [Pseudomonadota bacterium]
MIINLALLLFSYLLGSLASAVIVSKWMGLPDPRTRGSRNPGATNVLRLGHRRAAAIALLGDMLKGLIPVLAAHALGASSAVLAGVALAAFLGHLYPVFFGFRGGKGVATSLGVLLGLSWPAGLLCLATWLLVAAVTRISSLAALSAAFMAPLYMHWLGAPAEPLIATVIMTTLLVWRHRGNIQNILNGTESKIGARS